MDETIAGLEVGGVGSSDILPDTVVSSDVDKINNEDTQRPILKIIGLNRNPFNLWSDITARRRREASVLIDMGK